MANLSALLEKEASAEIEAILSEAQERASEIVSKAKEEAANIASQRSRSAANQAEALVVRAKSAAQLESSSLRLKAQHGVVENVMEAVKAKIKALKGKSYEEVLAKLLKEASDSLGGNVKEVIVNPKDQKVADKLLADAGLKAKVSTSDSIESGIRLKAEGSNVIIENSLLGRLNALKDELASDVSRVLFGKEA